MTIKAYKNGNTYNVYKETVQESVTHIIQYNKSENGTVSNNNFWDGSVTSNFDWSWHTKVGTITYGTNQRAGTWTLEYDAYRQSAAGLEVTIILNYADGTTATVYNKTDFPADNTTHLYSVTINATKAWKGYQIQMKAASYNVNYAYSGVGPVNYIKTSYSQIENVDKYKAFNV
ncbi:MAG: hypothetical protein IJ545_02085 [Alphaproteobacteria bacterium]|nr:hypothetical protein [Alphaproteobacteria bacterium]